MASVFGEKLNIEIYGTSHGPCVGVKMRGLPAGLSFDMQRLQDFLDRRAPGRDELSTSRTEDDVPRFLSGVAASGQESQTYTTDGNIIEAVIDNRDARSEDYDAKAVVPRPGHADYPAWVKYGVIEAGGGAFSGRMTAPLCIAGGICLQILENEGIETDAGIASIGNIENTDEAAFEEKKQLIASVKEEGDSIGGMIECVITGLPAGVGEPVFGSVESRICQAVFAVPGVKGIEFGAGFGVCGMKGSENNDPYEIEDGRVVTRTNNHGGILGGLTSGMPVVFRVAMKPTPSIAIEQDSVDLEKMEPAKLQVKGRYDPCIVPRAVPCIEAAAAIAVCDMLLEEGMIGAEEVTGEDAGECKEHPGLGEYRDEIDTIDAELAGLLQKRFGVVREIAALKEREGLPVLDEAREEEKIKKLEGLCAEDEAGYVTGTMRDIMARSRRLQEYSRLRYGLLGRKLGHSFSPQTHRLIGGYDFGLFEREPEELDDFFAEGSFKGLSVTMPYKKDVMKYCAELSETAKACGSVNTIVRRGDGTYFGDNTDYYGFRSTVESSGIDVMGKKTLVLGSGGVSGTVVRVLEDLGADPVIVISRTGEDSYDNIEKHSDARIIVNATPVGMYPKAGEAAVDMGTFHWCETVFDVIYNPLRTKLMLDAREAGIPAFGGLHMLAAQAAKASGLFLDEETDLQGKTRLAADELRKEIENIVLIGMPGSGKTTIGRELAELMGRDFIDCDEVIEDICGRSPEEIINEEGVDIFRYLEAQAIREIMRRRPLPDGSTPGIVFATGGGCVEREENRVPLLENSFVVYVERPLQELDTEGRPVSETKGNDALLERRRGLYEKWCDAKVEFGEGAAGETAALFEKRNSL
ncbi:MAG: chorismate synthase [Bacillota bacterium]